MTESASQKPLFFVELKTKRSANPRAGFVFLLVLGFFWSLIGGGTAYLGVWPLSVFYGAEFFLILGISAMFVKTGSKVEFITLVPDNLTVQGSGRYDVKKNFDPFSVAVKSETTDRRFCHIEISSPENQVIIGTLLSANACDTIVNNLNAALADLKAGSA